MNYIPFENNSSTQDFENDIILIDKYFKNSTIFNKKYRTNLLPKNKRDKENKSRWVTLCKCPLDLMDFDLTVQTCKQAESLLDSFKNS
ncbi:hypothetical protein CBF36_11555 [Vagococcus bubulae]|uniref:Uncharacterized protein n=1 Tax=Vagococcus bubulae TaxID=1977868 RepID=A0A429ZA69_9ENTE|nr:hypothetical protein CBF36_11555 [Vagococcus bubulae]